MISAADAAAAEPATQPTIRALIRTPSSGPTLSPAVSPQPTAPDKEVARTAAEGHRARAAGPDGGRPGSSVWLLAADARPPGGHDVVQLDDGEGDHAGHGVDEADQGGERVQGLCEQDPAPEGG